MQMYIVIALFALLATPLFCEPDDEQSVTNSDIIMESDLQHVPDVESDFSCENRNFGYYADMEADCSYFHLCHPIVSNQGDVVMTQFTFLCPNETIFNQKELDCEDEIKSIPCEESTKFFIVNDQFPSPQPLSEHNTQVVRPNL